MYAYIKGLITKINPSFIELENNNIGYLIKMPNPYVFKLYDEVTVYLYQNVFYTIKGKWSKFTLWFIGLFLVTLIIFGIVRNFPCLMFLSPTQLLDSVQ